MLKNLFIVLIIAIFTACGKSAPKKKENHPPQAYDKNITVTPGESVHIAFNGLDVDGDDFMYIITQLPEHGVFDPNSMTYKMQEGYYGTDELVFHTEDSELSSNDAKILFISTYDNPPTIELVGPSELNISLDSNYEDLGAIAFDIEDGNLTSLIEKGGYLNTNEYGRYNITYSVEDSASNRVSTKRIVNVIPEFSHSDDSVMIVDPTKKDLVVTYGDESSYEDSDVLTVNIHDNTPTLSEPPKMIQLMDNFWALKLKGHGLENSFHIVGYYVEHKYDWQYNDIYQNKYDLTIEAKFYDNFIIYVVLDFLSNGKSLHKDIVYTPSKYDYENYTDSNDFLHIYIGSDKKNGEWFRLERNILDDLHIFYPNATITDVNGIAIRGSGLVSCIKLSK